MKHLIAAIALALLAPYGIALADDKDDAAKVRREMMRVVTWDDAYRETQIKRNREWMALYNERNAKEQELAQAPNRETERSINNEIVRLQARMEALSGIEAMRPPVEQRLSREQWQTQVDAMARGIASVREEFDRQAGNLIRENIRNGTVSRESMRTFMETTNLLARARTLQNRLLPAPTIESESGYTSHIEFNRRMIEGATADYGRIDRLAAALGTTIGDADYARLTEQFREAARQIREMEQGISLMSAAERGRTGTGSEAENRNMQIVQEVIRQAASTQQPPAQAPVTRRPATIAPPSRTPHADRNRWGQRFMLQPPTDRPTSPEFTLPIDMGYPATIPLMRPGTRIDPPATIPFPQIFQLFPNTQQQFFGAPVIIPLLQPTTQPAGPILIPFIKP